MKSPTVWERVLLEVIRSAEILPPNVESFKADGLLLLDAPYLLSSFWTSYINTSGFYEKSSFPCAAVYFSSTIFKSAEALAANLKSLYPHMVGFLYSSHKLHLFGRSLPHPEHHVMTHNLSTRTRCINSDQWDDSVPPSSSALEGR
ncbi:hypothetical protein ALC57_09604 [Trachymyrmex cornetzi]|uniref:Uncharacterized protein n=1 Tax=Trachymyrmex cornetzi TaxID=471704 RepID=A0A195DZ41_9HYME|nr:hypothetical protein ALC57_09604 [Trachymyrmex cornetzi]